MHEAGGKLRRPGLRRRRRRASRPSRSTGKPLGTLAAPPRRRLLRGPLTIRERQPLRYRAAQRRRRVVGRRPLLLRPGARAAGRLLIGEGTPPPALRQAGRAPDRARRRATACISPSGRRTRGGSRSSATSTPGTGGATSMRKRLDTGVWEIFVPDVGAGTLYKYEIVGAGRHAAAAQGRSLRPRARSCGPRPPRSSRRARRTTGATRRTAPSGARADARRAADVDLRGALWARGGAATDGGFLSYDELADQLDPLRRRHGLHPHRAHAGQRASLRPVLGLPADRALRADGPLRRAGGLRALRRRRHRAGIGVILDWVPAHFPDRRARARAASTAPRSTSTPIRARASIPTGTPRSTTSAGARSSNYLITNALYWLEPFHVDGLRVDAVASMLYLDYSRKDGRVAAQRATAAARTSRRSPSCRRLNERRLRQAPRARSRSPRNRRRGPGYRSPVYAGGLGFGFKWNMGWMHDTLAVHGARAGPPALAPRRADVRPALRLLRELRAAALPRRGRARQGLAARQDGRRRLAEVREPARLLRASCGAIPGKKLLFMGQEFAQGARVVRGARARLVAARHRRRTAACRALVRDLNRALPRDAGAARARLRGRGLRVARSPTTARTRSSPGCARRPGANAGGGGLELHAGAARAATACRCRAPGAGARSSTPTPSVYGGSGIGNLGGVDAREPTHGRRSARR